MGQRRSEVDKVIWQDRPVFITGATGLLGGWLVKHLLEKQSDIVCLVRDWIPQSVVIKDLIDKVKIVRGDVCDQSLIERIFGEYEIDTVFHLAAQTIVGVANRNPIQPLNQILRGMWTVWKRAKEVKQLSV